MLALVSQWFAPALHALASSQEPVGVAAELRATFGDVAVLCVQAETTKGPLSPADPREHGDECCPYCQASFAGHSLLPPATIGAPERMDARAEFVAPARNFGRARPRRIPLAQPRAPPFEA